MTSQRSERKPRLPQRTRAHEEALPPFQLTKRDRDVVLAVYTHRALTPQQISNLLFVPAHILHPPLPSSRCRHRLKMLFQKGLLSRDELPQLLSEGRKPYVYRLASGGAAMVSLHMSVPVEELDFQPNEKLGHLFVEHHLAIIDVIVACIRSAKRHGFTIEKYLDDRTLKTYQKDTVTLTSTTGRKQTAAVVPDAYFHLKASAHHYHQFLEVDRSTETGRSMTWGRRTWARKVISYIEYYRSGMYHERYHTKSMRVLTVTTSEKRLENLKAITEACGGQSRFWFTTMEQLQSSDVLVDPIWQVAHRQGLSSLTW
ncbi:MAG: replication-relaxation family protein [Caldilineaceae bacterium]|nr:replication-relaxation family protein [Caldilineaceae bacterium]